MSVCLFVCLLAYLENYKADLYQIFVRVGRGLILLWRRCGTLNTFGFVDDITFS